MKADLLIGRLRRLPVRQLIQRLRPKSIDAYLYLGKESSNMHSRRLITAVSIETFSIDHPSGHDQIDKRLTRNNIAYIVFISGKVAHQSWVFFNTLLPSQYGFDSHLPVIGDSYTAHGFRSQGLFQYSLGYILEDLRIRNISKSAYIITTPGNLSSIRALEKGGCQFLAHLRGTRLFGVFIINKSATMAA
jgi:hypothetical protein